MIIFLIMPALVPWKINVGRNNKKRTEGKKKILYQAQEMQRSYGRSAN